ncbi:MAG: hypothetical protein WC833_01845 [Bacteroidales bacterium]
MSAIWADMHFQMKQGFYLVYAIITLIYLLILSFFPENMLQTAVPLVVFSDPTVLGLFFIGGMIMLEKVQGVLLVVVVSPLRTWEYIFSKVISLALVSLSAGIVITALTPCGSVNWFVLLLSILLSSGIFTMCGIMICAGCKTVNQYFVKMVPYMLLFTLPCFSLIGFPFSWVFDIFPSVAALRLMMGAFSGMPVLETIGLTFYLVVLNYLCFRLTMRVFEKKIIFED